MRFHVCPRENAIFICLRDGGGFFYRRAEKEQAVSAALSDGQEPASSISLYVVQINMYAACVC